MSKKVIRHELVEIVIPAGSTQTKFMFPDLPNLRNVHIWGLQVYNADQITKSPISQYALLSKVKVLNESFITLLSYGGKEYAKQTPAIVFNTLQSDLSTSTNQHEKDFKNFVGQKTDWNKSYVEFANGTPGEVTAGSYLISVYYSYPIAQEKAMSSNDAKCQ